MSNHLVHVHLHQQQDYQFQIHFGEGVPVLVGDERVPLGQGLGPTPVQLLAAAAGNCLADSLLFALRKFKQAPEPITCNVAAEVGRNEQGRLRVQQINADLTLGVPSEQLEHLDRVLGQFKDFCTVASSIGQAIPLQVTVRDSTGRQLN